MLPFEVVQNLKGLTEKWHLRSLGQTICDLMDNYSQLIGRYNKSQKEITELKEEIVKWRDIKGASKTITEPETSK